VAIVVRPKIQFGRDREGCKGFATICLDPADVGIRRKSRIGIDEIGDVVLVIGAAKTDEIIEERLLEADVIAGTFLRLQIWIAEKAKCREIDVEFAQTRRLEAGPKTSLQDRFRPRNVKARRKTIGRVPAIMAS
jgi:hypothetical protein